MKKLFILFALLCGAVCYADKGYDGLEWGQYKNKIPFSNELIKIETEAFSNFGLKTIPFKKIKMIAGEKIPVYYHFGNDEKDFYLCAVAYAVDSEKTNRIKSNFKNLILSKKITIDFSKINEDDKENNIFALPLTLAFYSIVDSEVYFEMLDPLNTKLEDIKDFPVRTDEPGELSIYDYNDDTRVYIFDRITNDKTVVVYVPHEQDY